MIISSPSGSRVDALFSQKLVSASKLHRSCVVNIFEVTTLGMNSAWRLFLTKSSLSSFLYGLRNLPNFFRYSWLLISIWRFYIVCAYGRLPRKSTARKISLPSNRCYSSWNECLTSLRSAEGWGWVLRQLCGRSPSLVVEQYSWTVWPAQRHNWVRSLEKATTKRQKGGNKKP